jgi:hypothetical protein
MGLHSQEHEACSHSWAPSSFPPNFSCFQELIFQKLIQKELILLGFYSEVALMGADSSLALIVEFFASINLFII